MAKVTRGCRHTGVLFQNYFQIAMTQGDVFLNFLSRVRDSSQLDFIVPCSPNAVINSVTSVIGVNRYHLIAHVRYIKILT